MKDDSFADLLNAPGKVNRMVIEHKRIRCTVKYFFFLIFLSAYISSQAQTTSDTALTIEGCISFALQNDINVRQSRMDETIGEHEIRAALSGWLPQISAQYNYSHNFKLATAAFGETLIRIGRKNNSNILFQLNQTLFSNDLLLASRASKYNRIRLNQNTEAEKINTISEVSKAFYDILLTNEQLKILDENIARQEKQYRDAYSRYEFGLVDKTDYQRASITLANTRSEKKRTQESLHFKHALLKQLMGYPLENDFTLLYDTTRMEEEAIADTLKRLDYGSRIEIRLLETHQQLLHFNSVYHRLGFLPSVSAFANYNFIYFNNDLSELYNQTFPTSQGGVNVVLPIFQGSRRWQNVRISELREERIRLDLVHTKLMIQTEFQTAMADYKSNYNEWNTLRENVKVAREVYGIIKYQYDEGVKAYIDLIVAETDLKSAQLNYYNALYRLLVSKIDLEKALGTLDVNR